MDVGLYLGKLKRYLCSVIALFVVVVVVDSFIKTHF